MRYCVILILYYLRYDLGLVDACKQAASGGGGWSPVLEWTRGWGYSPRERVRRFRRRPVGGRSASAVARWSATVGRPARARARNGVGRWADGGRFSGPEGGGRLCPAGNARARAFDRPPPPAYTCRARIIPVFFLYTALSC